MQATRPSQSAARVRTLCFSFCLSVCLSSREFIFRPSNLNIACSIANSLSPLMEKVYFYCTFVSREPRTVYKVKKVGKTIFWAYESQIPLSKISKGLEDFSTHNVLKRMCRLRSFLLIFELYPLEFHPGPCLRSAGAGKGLYTRQ